MSVAEIIPIALVLDERTGYTLWAPPWEEDGETWQAFLGKDDKILLFSSPAQLAQFIRDDDDHDLLDHPDWDEWEDADPFDLVPDDDQVFDLDGVYEIVGHAPDRWSVTDLGRTLGIVDSIAQCCDEEIVEPLAQTPELSLVGQGPGAFSGRSGERAWDAVALAISGKWEEVCEGISEWVSWREPVTLDKELSAAQAEIDSANVPIDDPEALIEAEENAREEDDESDYLEERDEREEAALDAEDDITVGDDSDERDSDDDDLVDEDDALPYRPLASGDDEEIDADTAYAFWEESGILPVRAIFPKENFDGAEAFTLRCYVDDQAVFMGTDNNPWLFRSADTMLDVIEDEDQNDPDKPGHDLRPLATWPEVVEAVMGDMPLAIAPEDDVDVEAADSMIRGELPFVPETVANAADFLLDLTEYGELDGSRVLLDGDGELAEVLSSAREGASVQLDDADQGVVEQWEQVLGEVASIIEWAD